MSKNDITRYAINFERALTAMFDDSRILVYRIDNMDVSRQGDGYHIYINLDIPTCD